MHNKPRYNHDFYKYVGVYYEMQHGKVMWALGPQYKHSRGGGAGGVVGEFAHALNDRV
jgi:hypothetical protein